MVTKAVIPPLIFKGKLHFMSNVHAINVKNKKGSMPTTNKLNVDALKELCLPCNI
jgi:hypothetical protein